MGAASWPFGDYPSQGLQALSPHVTAFFCSGFPLSNAAIVSGAEATLVFDTANLSYAVGLRAAVPERPPLRDVVISHVHGDHAHGAMRFEPARFWARSFTRERLAFWAGHDLTPYGEEYERHVPGALEEYERIRIVVPDTVLDEPTQLDLGGGVAVRLIPEPTAHTPGDLWALVEPDGVALCGDLWWNGAEPNLSQGSIEGSLAALARLREAGAGVYLPGHGPAGALESRDMMERYCTWLRASIDGHMAAGLSGDALAAAVREEFEEQKVSSDDPITFALESEDGLEGNVAQAESPSYE
jgi:glyoxylase-like metal-dependent hydrolase (beta-lactamase superfamily II)